jgi:hypothetical protein
MKRRGFGQTVNKIGVGISQFFDHTQYHFKKRNRANIACIRKYKQPVLNPCIEEEGKRFEH